MTQLIETHAEVLEDLCAAVAEIGDLDYLGKLRAWLAAAKDGWYPNYAELQQADGYNKAFLNALSTAVQTGMEGMEEWFVKYKSLLTQYTVSMSNINNWYDQMAVFVAGERNRN